MTGSYRLLVEPGRRYLPRLDYAFDDLVAFEVVVLEHEIPAVGYTVA